MIVVKAVHPKKKRIKKGRVPHKKTHTSSQSGAAASATYRDRHKERCALNRENVTEFHPNLEAILHLAMILNI